MKSEHSLWQPHCTDHNPLSDFDRVEVMFANGSTGRGDASVWDWAETGDYEIVAYRIWNGITKNEKIQIGA